VRGEEWVRFVIRFEVLDLQQFRAMADAMVAASNTEPGTVVYDWYLRESEMTGTLYEAYASQEALQVHAKGTVFTTLAPQYAGASRVLSVDVFGEVPGMGRRDLLGAPTTWWDGPIAAVSAPG
jgi:quinol monooxygenase YgiN